MTFGRIIGGGVSAGIDYIGIVNIQEDGITAFPPPLTLRFSLYLLFIISFLTNNTHSLTHSYLNRYF